MAPRHHTTLTDAAVGARVLLAGVRDDAESGSVTIAAFQDAVAGVANIVQAERLFGDPDYLLRVVTEELAEFQQLYDSTLAALPGVQRLTSTLNMKSVVEHRPRPT
jgi:DNA-binding Lrp family transcriptional regulator